MGKEGPPSSEDFIEAIYDTCMNHWSHIWLVADNIILTTGVLANAVLLMLFLRDRKSLSASQILGMNLVIMNLTYLTVIPVSVFSRMVPRNITRFDMPDKTRSERVASTTFTMRHLRQIFNIFILIGTPLLLTCMCIERHLAVSHPVLYMKIKERKYRVMVSAVVWLITLGFCAVSAFTNQTLLMIGVSITISFLFMLMLFCLWTMVWSLWRPSPALHGVRSRSESPQKRQAVQSLLIVVATAISVYLPVLVLFPFVLYIYYNKRLPFPLEVVCNVFECILLFPCFGVLVGPLFFFSKAKQMFKFKRTTKPLQS